MSRPIGSDQPCPVHGKSNRKPLDRYIMDDLVIGPLQEGGIYHRVRLKPLSRHARSKGHAMLLGNTHIEATIREFVVKQVKAGPGRHGSSNGYDAIVFLCLRDQRLREDLCVRRGVRL